MSVAASRHITLALSRSLPNSSKIAMAWPAMQRMKTHAAEVLSAHASSAVLRASSHLDSKIPATAVSLKVAVWMVEEPRLAPEAGELHLAGDEKRPLTVGQRWVSKEEGLSQGALLAQAAGEESPQR